MALAWERTWRVLATKLCIRAQAQSAANENTTRAPWEWEDDESPDTLSPVRAGSWSSMEVCAICLGGMSPGHGQALFTAECSHKFHFHCISSSVQHGNRVCPICRALWKELPLPANATGGTVSSPVWPQNCRLSRPNQRDQLPIFHAPESCISYDYECTNPRSKTSSGTRDQEAAGASDVEIMSFKEFPAIQQSVTEEKFDILIHLKAPRLSAAFASSRAAAIDLVAVLDVSGSMAGTKLALLTRTMSFLIESLGPNDRLSVIAFQYSAWSLFPFRKMTAAGRWYSLQAIGQLRAGGGSNVAEALRKAARVMEDRQARNTACSILLFSDGDGLGSRQTTTWPSLDYGAFVPRSIRPGSGHHVRIHTFGFGADHDPTAMRGVAEMSGGTFSFIDTVGSVPNAFDRCIGGLCSVVAQETRLSVQCAEKGILLTSVVSGGYGSTVDADGRGGFVDIGDLYAGEERDFLFTLNVPATPGEDSALLVPSCTYRAAATMETVRVECDAVVVHRPAHPVGSSPMSVEVERERHRIHAMEIMATARDAAEQGDFARAASILEGRRRELESRASLSADERTLALVAELREMQDRMETRRRYERSGRTNILAALSAHSWQCPTTRDGDSAELAGLTHTYQMPCMLEMIQRSQLLLPEAVEEMNRSPATSPSRALASPPSRSGRPTKSFSRLYP